jgi:hypothetical protein
VESAVVIVGSVSGVPIRFDISGPAAPVTGSGPVPGWYPRAVTTAIATSPDGQWIAVRQSARVQLYTQAGDIAGEASLTTSDVDLAIVGPPTTVVAVERHDDETALIALAAPGLGETARVTLDGSHELAATTGPRLALIERRAHSLCVLRASGRAFMSQPCDAGGPVELVASLDRNQLLVVLAKRLEVWDAVSARPLLRPSFTLPPAPRRIGAATGHVWCYQPGGTELVLYRLSDGRPFAHRLGAPIEAVVAHPAAPYVVAVTAAGLFRIQAFAHTTDRITAPPAEAYGLAAAATVSLGPTVTGTDLQLVGALADGPPWRQPLVEPTTPEAAPSSSEAMALIRAARDAGPARESASGPSPTPAWRDPLVAFAGELAKLDPDRAPPEVPPLPLGTPLAELCHRAQLATPARRAITALYACYLVGDPAIPIARLARVVAGTDGWREALATGELADRRMITSSAGRVALCDPIARAIDGAPPHAIDVIGTGAASIVAGVHVADPSRLGEPIAALTEALGSFALVTGPLATAVIEAFAHGLTAGAIAGPSVRLRPVRVPRGGGLVVVAAPTALPPAMLGWPTFELSR